MNSTSTSMFLRHPIMAFKHKLASMGVDYAKDENVLQVDTLQHNSELAFFKMLLKMDVNIVKPSEIVAHLPFTYTA